MNLIKVFFTSIGSLAMLFVLTKIMGNKSMSELNMFDYICGITIGSIAAEMATNLEELTEPLLAMVIYATFSVVFSYLNYKSIKLRRLLTGKSLILLNNGKLYKENLKKARVDLNEFLMLCRNEGYFDVSTIETAVLEPNGKISILPTTASRPVNTKDLALTPTDDKPVSNVIIDGHIMVENLRFTGNNEKWLDKQLHAQGVSRVSEVFLATCDHHNNLSVYVKIKKPFTHDVFE